MAKVRDMFNSEKYVIAMIHLAGEGRKEKLKRALEELAIYEQEGVDAAIVEDYYGSLQGICDVLLESKREERKIIRGVNYLRNPYLGFEIADDFNAKFVQFDSVQTKDLKLAEYNDLRKRYPKIAVLGGVGFKYIQPTGNPVEQDINEGKSRCEAIVTTGSGTGIETPIEKLQEYRKILGKFPLIVGAGVNLDNVSEQLKICDGAIIGSYFKPNSNTRLKVDEYKVRDLMSAVKEVRK